jgi:hypothetical protein
VEKVTGCRRLPPDPALVRRLSARLDRRRRCRCSVAAHPDSTHTDHGNPRRELHHGHKITTVRRSDVGERVGRVSATTLVEIERSLLAFLGIAD